MTRLKDIAQAVGVSVSTVSLVLNGKSRGRVNDETARAVRESADRLGYYPNLAAKSLRSKRTHTIGLLSDSIAGSPFSPELIRGAQQAAWDAGYVLFSVYLRTDRDSEELALQSLLQRDVEGLILATDYHRVRSVPSLPNDVPIVCADCRPADESGAGYAVVPDEYQGAYTATSHLIENGHTRIGYIGTADRGPHREGPRPRRAGGNGRVALLEAVGGGARRRRARDRGENGRGGGAMSATHDPRITFGAAVTALASEDERIVVLSADSGKSSGFGPFMAQFPERYVECGIQEQGVTGVAAGLATMGKVPVFCAIAPFVTCRNFEQMRNDLGYMRQNAKIVGRNGGFTYSDLGATHHSLEDYALMRMIPGMTVLAPQDYHEIQGAVAAMLRHEGPVYMRIGSGGVPELFPDDEFEIGKGRHVREGGDVSLVTTGYVTASVLDAADLLATRGIEVDLVCLGTVEPLDKDLVLASARRTGRVVTVEEHYDRGGLGGAVAELLAANPVARHHVIAVPHDYVPSGPYADLLWRYGLDGQGISRRVVELLRVG